MYRLSWMLISVLFLSGFGRQYVFQVSESIPQQPIETPWLVHLAKGDAKKMGDFFAPMIKLELPSDKGDYSKNQAVMILSAFFNTYPALNAVIKQTGKASQSNTFFIGEYTHSKNVFRLYVQTHEAGDRQIIHSLSITSK